MIFFIIPVITSTIVVAYTEYWCVPNFINGNGSGTVQDVYYEGDGNEYNVQNVKGYYVKFHFDEMDNYRKVKIVGNPNGWWDVRAYYTDGSYEDLGRWDQDTEQWNLDTSRTLDYIMIKATTTTLFNSPIDYLRCLHRNY